MSLTVAFTFDSALRACIQRAKEASEAVTASTNGECDEHILALHVEKETFLLFKEYDGSSRVGMGELPVPVFFLCRDVQDPAQWGVVTYVSDTCPPKKKMIAASCCVYLKKECGLNVVNEKRVFNEEDVPAALKEVNEDARERAMARAERYAAALKQAEEELAPRPMVGMGTSMNVTMNIPCHVAEEIKAFLTRREPDRCTLTLRIDEKEVVAIDRNKGLVDGVNLPCFYLAYVQKPNGGGHEEKNPSHQGGKGNVRGGEGKEDTSITSVIQTYQQVCFYVLSSVAKPKERMRYASAKEQLLKELRAMGATFAKCEECSSAEEVMEVVHEGEEVVNQWDFGTK